MAEKTLYTALGHFRCRNDGGGRRYMELTLWHNTAHAESFQVYASPSERNGDKISTCSIPFAAICFR